MSAQGQHKQSLSEISHLFLSGVRERVGGELPRPKRTPPAALAPVIATEPEPLKVGPVSAVLASHLGEAAVESALAYARHLACNASLRVGVIELDASSLRLYRIERHSGAPAPAVNSASGSETHQLRSAIEEMNWEIDRWLVVIRDPRLPEARVLLRQISHWVLVSAATRDGVVASYRALKGLAETDGPELSLAVVGAPSAAEADRIGRKLAGVAVEFLHWAIADRTTVAAAPGHVAQAVLAWEPTRDKAQMAGGIQWHIVGDFVKHAEPLSAGSAGTVAAAEDEAELNRELDDDKPKSSGAPAVLHTIRPEVSVARSMDDEVLDLADEHPASVLDAVVQRHAGQWVQCPIAPPNCPDARLVVTREGGLMILATAQTGLANLRAIANALAWLAENRPLIVMALPQLSIDARREPALRLLVNHAELPAHDLRSLFPSPEITVHSYRTVRWGQKMGLLLAAA